MEFFEKLGKKASETYKSAAEKTNKIASETKLKLKINDNKAKIKEIYTQIGQKVYEKHVLDAEMSILDEIKEDIDKIDELSNEIKDYERQKLELADIKQCINCKIEIDVSAKFCPDCGAEQPKIKEDDAHEVEVIEKENKCCCHEKYDECNCTEDEKCENSECNCVVEEKCENSECNCVEEEKCENIECNCTENVKN